MNSMSGNPKISADCSIPQLYCPPPAPPAKPPEARRHDPAELLNRFSSHVNSILVGDTMVPNIE